MPKIVEGQLVVKKGTRFGIALSRTNALISAALVPILNSPAGMRIISTSSIRVSLVGVSVRVTATSIDSDRPAGDFRSFSTGPGGSGCVISARRLSAVLTAEITRTHISSRLTGSRRLSGYFGSLTA